MDSAPSGAVTDDSSCNPVARHRRTHHAESSHFHRGVGGQSPSDWQRWSLGLLLGTPHEPSDVSTGTLTPKCALLPRCCRGCPAVSFVTTQLRRSPVLGAMAAACPKGRLHAPAPGTASGPRVVEHPAALPGPPAAALAPGAQRILPVPSCQAASGSRRRFCPARAGSAGAEWRSLTPRGAPGTSPAPGAAGRTIEVISIGQMRWNSLTRRQAADSACPVWCHWQQAVKTTSNC
jgi:hypothetical protein